MQPTIPTPAGAPTAALQFGDYAGPGNTCTVTAALPFLQSIVQSDCISVGSECVNIRYSGGPAVVLPPSGTFPLPALIRMYGGYSAFFSIPANTSQFIKFEIVVTLIPNHGGGPASANGGTSDPLTLSVFIKEWADSENDPALRNDLIVATFPGVSLSLYNTNKAEWLATQVPPTPFTPTPI